MMIVYGSTLSPFVRKTMAYGAEKGLGLELQAAFPGSTDPEFRKISPFGKIPGFRDGDFTICDSSAIIAYLEAKHPEPALIPAEPQARARVVWYDEFADTIMVPVMAKLFFNRIVAPRFMGKEGDLGAADQAEREELPPLFAYIESVIPASGFLVGDHLTLADIAVASPLVNIQHAGHVLDKDAYPKTAAYAAAIHARASFAPLIAAEKAMLGL
jgi:glutathione S-transferase